MRAAELHKHRNCGRKQRAFFFPDLAEFKIFLEAIAFETVWIFLRGVRIHF